MKANRSPRARATARIRIRGRRQITLPPQATEALGVAEGDELEARILSDRIELIPLVAIPKDQAWFWTPEWQAKEREAEADLAAGNYHEFATADKLVARLKKK
jgi:bifunctional DNA-binding transcriptional regulator/antitoxin component of YhaV-PrlF toxin-antitoxin module